MTRRCSARQRIRRHFDKKPHDALDGTLVKNLYLCRCRVVFVSARTYKNLDALRTSKISYPNHLLPFNIHPIPSVFTFVHAIISVLLLLTDRCGLCGCWLPQCVQSKAERVCEGTSVRVLLTGRVVRYRQHLPVLQLCSSGTQGGRQNHHQSISKRNKAFLCVPLACVCCCLWHCHQT